MCHLSARNRFNDSYYSVIYFMCGGRNVSVIFLHFLTSTRNIKIRSKLSVRMNE